MILPGSIGIIALQAGDLLLPARALGAFALWVTELVLCVIVGMS
jgi:hypothetical protein